MPRKLPTMPKSSGNKEIDAFISAQLTWMACILLTGEDMLEATASILEHKAASEAGIGRFFLDQDALFAIRADLVTLHEISRMTEKRPR